MSNAYSSLPGSVDSLADYEEGSGGGGHFFPKDLHNLSKMFIQANVLLPRPRSESNFQVGN